MLQRITPLNGQILVAPMASRREIITAAGIALSEGEESRSYLERATVIAAAADTAFDPGDVIIRHKTDGHRYLTDDGKVAWFMDARNVKAVLVPLTPEEEAALKAPEQPAAASSPNGSEHPAAEGTAEA